MLSAVKLTGGLSVSNDNCVKWGGPLSYYCCIVHLFCYTL